MKIKILRFCVLFQRWSYAVPLLCYLLFFCMIWTLSVPLKPVKEIKKEYENSIDNEFQRNVKNSNFNSDNSLLDEKNEYLVNVNDKDNKNKDQTEILEDVFKR